MRNNTSYTGKLSAGTRSKVEKLLKMREELLVAIKYCDANCGVVSDPYKYCADDDDVDEVEAQLHDELLELEGLEMNLRRVERLLEKLGVKPSQNVSNKQETHEYAGALFRPL